VPFYRPPTSIHPGAPIKLSSPKLLSSAANIKRFDQEQAAATEEYSALTSLERPDIGPTVTRYERPVEKSTIDLTDRRPVPGRRETPGTIDEAARHKNDVDRLLRGEELEEFPDLRARKSKVARKASAIQTAKELEQREFQAEFLKLSAAHCQTLKPDHDAKMKQFFKSFGEAFSIFSELQKTKRDLVDSQMGFGGLFGVDLDFLRGEDVRSMFVEGKRLGFVNSIPAAFQ
jgi:hypothetical protein